MAETQTFHFPCPSCGARCCQVEEPDGDIHAGETYHCNECGAAVVFVALSMEMLADPAAIRWGCHFCKPGPCRLAPSTGETENTDTSNKEERHETGCPS